MSDLSRPDWVDNPLTTSRSIGGTEFRFDRHHAITMEAFNNNSFLHAMERTGLFIQNNFSQNGVYLENN